MVQLYRYCCWRFVCYSEVYCFHMGYRSGRILRACLPHFRTHWELDIRFLLAWPFWGAFCSIGFIFGALYRLAMIPMIFTMGVAFFVIHGNDPFSLKELAFVYLVVFILMYIAGPGKFSLDRLIAVFVTRLAK